MSSKHSYLTLLINAAGILHVPDVLSPGTYVMAPFLQQAVGVTAVFVSAETALTRLESSSLQKVFAVNAFGPILVSKASWHKILPQSSLFQALHNSCCKFEGALCRPLCHCCQREQKMVLNQGTSYQHLLHHCSLCKHLSYAGLFSFILVFSAATPQHSEMELITRCCAKCTQSALTLPVTCCSLKKLILRVICFAFMLEG